MTRRNGLSADSWSMVGVVDSGAADGILAALERAGVAAYVTPHTDHLHLTMPVLGEALPRERLYVDAAARERALQLLGSLESAPPPATRREGPEREDAADVDEEFARIVRGFRLDEAVGERPAQAEEMDPAPKDQTSTDDIGWGTGSEPAPTAQPDVLDNDHYVPPHPEPLPETDFITRLAWLCAVGSPLLLLVLPLIGVHLTSTIAGGIAAAFMGGFGLLVWRMSDGDDDEGDDGAVV